MEVIKDLYGIEIKEATYNNKFKYSSPNRKLFSLNISNFDYSDSNTLVIWNFGDSNNTQEVRSTNLLEVVEHEFSYAGIYTITALIYIDSYVIHASMNLEVSEGFLPVYINVPPGEIYTNQLISFSTFDDSNKIYYSLDNTDPFENGILYLTPFEISTSTLIRYGIVKKDGSKSEEFQAQYILTVLYNPNIFIEPLNTNFTNDIEVSLSYNSLLLDAYYSIENGDVIKYVSPFTIQSSSLVKYFTISKTGIEYPYHLKSYFIDKTHPILFITPEEGTYFNELNISMIPNKSDCLITYSVSGNQIKSYSGSIDIFTELPINTEVQGVYNIPFYAKIEDSFGRYTEYNKNYILSIDNEGPSLTFLQTPNSPTTGTSFSFLFTINDNTELEIKEAYVFVKFDDNDYEVYGLCNSGSVYQYHLFDVQPGEHHLFFNLTDKARNQSEIEFVWNVIES